MESETKKIGVVGAGSIGLFVGGRLAAAGHDVLFLGRQRLKDEIDQVGLCLTDIEGDTVRLNQVDFQIEPSQLCDCDLILVTAKSSGTAEIGQLIDAHAPTAQVVSLQNGVSNADALRETAPRADVRAGVVAFNVVKTGQGGFRKSTSGGVQIEDPSEVLAQRLNMPGLRVDAVKDMKPVQWGKLLVNLNNALNALSGETLLHQLQIRGWRRVLAAQMQETLNVLKFEGIEPARYTAVPVHWVPFILRLPTPLFRRIASQMLKIDPAARSSMQDDLRVRRATEIDALQGAVLKLAAVHNIACPTIDAVVQAIQNAEKENAGPPNMSPEEFKAFGVSL